MSYVLRPRSRSNGAEKVSSIAALITSSHRGATQPPKRNPPVGPSLGPPGACITPSRLTNAPVTIFRMGASFRVFIDATSRRGRDRRGPDGFRQSGPPDHIGPTGQNVGVRAAFSAA